MLVPAMKPTGHSHARRMSPKTRLMICNIGAGLTAESRVLVRKSQNILGQKKASTAAAIWSIRKLVPICTSLPRPPNPPTGCCSEDDEACPVVLDKSTHGV